MKVIDLFCGCGGLSLGFQQAGYTLEAGFDNWEAAVRVYEANFKHPIYKVDLSDIQTVTALIKPYSPQMIIGGPPCQDFSSAGLRNEDNGRGGLTVSFAQIVSAIRPEWFVMENVSTIVGTQKLVLAKRLFTDAGYGMTQVVLNAALCGVPQKRKRFFLIGRRGVADNFMEDVIRQHLARKEMTVKDYLGSKLDVQFYYRHPRSYARRGVFSVNEPSPTIRGVNRPIPAGYTLHTNDPVDSLQGIRPLTTHERSMIQTFPEDFLFVGKKSDVEQMIGNAVPVNLAMFVANVIKDYCHIEMQQQPFIPLIRSHTYIEPNLFSN